MAYTPNPQHRNTAFASVKSQWLVPQAAEVGCFALAIRSNWTANDCYWGLHIVEEGPTPLGRAPAPASCELHMAKFVGDTLGNWHGYPVAHWLSPFDKPAADILISWMQLGFINKPTMSKIHRGKKCTL